MKQTSICIKVKYFILKALQLQLFITLISLPILLNWGLPISLLSPLANIIFVPFLTLFLLLSSIIFFFELIYIPNNLFINLLEKLNFCWMKIFNLVSNKWLITLHAKPQLLLILLPFAAFVALQNKKTNSLKNSIIIFSLLIFGFCICSKLYVKNLTFNNDVYLQNKKIKIIRENNKITLNDNGEFSKIANPNNFVDYNLLTYLNKEFGSSNLDICVVSCNNRTFNIVKLILEKAKINKIHLVGKISKPVYKKFLTLNTVILVNEIQ